jgi:Protein of unknown function (DUF1592)/Protein of unknown function (DUF1588)/Protein of unknown function (DUF1595)/Protein of unknown function (DUF1587)/Protein of unknown function (DUF1585)
MTRAELLPWRGRVFALPWGAWLGLALLSAGCQGNVEGALPTTPQPIPSTSGGSASTPGSGGQPPTCTTPAPGPSPLRRLTHREYDNTTRDLLGDDSHQALQFSREELFLGFDNNATARGTTTLLAEQYMNAAETLAANAVKNLQQLTSCDANDAAGRDACARGFIDRFGAKAFRAPLADAERARLTALYASASTAWGFSKGIELTMAAILQSPRYLYRVEFGVAPASPSPAPNVKALTPYELASRLSYLLWGTMPDQALLDAASTGQLTKREQLATHARRLLASDRSHYVMTDFHRQWLGLDLIDNFDSTVTGFSNDLRPLMHQETARLVEAAIWQGGGKLSTLLTAPFSFMNQRLASFYGVTGPSGDAFEKVTLDPQQRLGILTQGGILAAHSHAAKTSPVLRGKFVREQLLCNPPPPPPPGVDFTVAEKDSSLTVREQSAAHRADPACAACHRFMDPIGLTFEGFDAAGRYRTLDNAKPVDTSGELTGTDVDGPVSGPTELGQKLASSAQVKNCVVRQWFRYAYARDEVTDQDACNVANLESAFATSDGNIPELLFALTQTDAFGYRSVAAGEAP